MACLVWVSYFVSVLAIVYVALAAATENQELDLCGFGDVDQTNGSIFLKVDGSDSSSKLLCSRVIRITGAGRLLMNFTDFRIASEDNFELFDGPHSSARKLTSISIPFVFSASGNAVFIRFQRKNGLKVASSSFRASFHAVPYPSQCSCRPVKNGALVCEDKYHERSCYVKCDKGHHDISLGKNITCDMQKEGKWNIDIHERTLSCQKVSVPLKIRRGVRFNYLNGTCEQLNLRLIKELFIRFLTTPDVQKYGKCFGGQGPNCIGVRCENGSRMINVNITDESKEGTFEDLYKAYDALGFESILDKLRELNVSVNMTSLVTEGVSPLCQDPTHSFFKLLITDNGNFSYVCSSCPLHHFYDPDTCRCKVCPQGSTAPEGAISCAKNGSSPGVPIQHKCDTRCMLGKQYNKMSGFCEWCPEGQYQDSKELNPTCQQCPPDQYTPFSGAADISDCYEKCNRGTFINLNNHLCEKCPADTYQDQKNLFTRCKTCGHGRHTAADGSTEEEQCFGPCSPGTFFDEQARRCAQCPINSYNDEVNEAQCKNCSDGKVTLYRGAKNKSDCIVPCHAGQLFDVETGRCENCKTGSFQDRNSHLEPTCKRCKLGETTQATGAKNVSECMLACPAGEFAHQKQCQKCSKGYFQDLPNQSSCKKCPDGKTTWGEGQTNLTACAFSCPAGKFLDSRRKNCSSCPFGTYQDATEHSSQQCNLCPSRQTSVVSGATSVSFCIDCAMFPCQHGAPCIPENGGFTCHCGAGLHGKYCEVIENKDKLRTVDMSLHFTSLDWKVQLENHKTHQYNMTKGLIESVIGKVMSGSDQFVAVEVTDLKKGSVVAYLTLYFGEKSDPIPGRKLQIAAAHGSVGNLTISSLEILLNRNDWQANDTNEVIQIDFQEAVNITAVASQGMLLPSQECFVNSYKLAFSDDGQTWTNYTEKDKEKIFVGNNNSDAVVKHYLESPVSAHFIRFKAQSFRHHICMRIEVYGYLLDPTSPDIPSTSPPAVTTATASQSSLVHTTPLASKSKFGWGAYLGIVFFVLFVAGAVVAICCWKHKSKSKKLAVQTPEQDCLLGVRTPDGIGGYKYVKKAADSLDGEEIKIEENQV